MPDSVKLPPERATTTARFGAAVFGAARFGWTPENVQETLPGTDEGRTPPDGVDRFYAWAEERPALPTWTREP